MGVGSSREIEEQLEAALALLDAARSKQDALRKENDALQARITAQAASLLLHEDQAVHNSVHLVQQREPLSKRVLFSMGVVAPLATHLLARGLGLHDVLYAVHVADATALVQGGCLCLVLGLLLRLRRYRWRRIRRERVVTRGASGTLESPATRSPRPSVDGAGVDGRPRTQTSALLATEAELAVLCECKRELYKIESRPYLLPDHEPLLDVQLIRFLREHGPNTGKIVSCYRRALEWRQKALPLDHLPTTEDPLGWLSASEMVYGEWATRFAHIGMFCGKSKIGCPVKIVSGGPSPMTYPPHPKWTMQARVCACLAERAGAAWPVRSAGAAGVRPGLPQEVQHLLPLSNRVPADPPRSALPRGRPAGADVRGVRPARAGLPHDDHDRDQLYQRYSSELLGALPVLLP